MGSQLAAEYKRQDAFKVNPKDIIVREELRGRWRAPDNDKIAALAISMIDHGQQQAVVCRKNHADKTLTLVSGFTRTAAARLIRAGFSVGDRSIHDPEFMLSVTIVDADDKRSFVCNVVENAHRNETSPVDDAYNHNILRTRHGLSDVEITKLYGYTDPTKVGRYRKLLSLSSEVQDLVHDGAMAVAAALDLLSLSEDEQRKVIEEAKKADGKINGAVVRAAVRRHEELKIDDQILADDDGHKPSVGPNAGANTAVATETSTSTAKTTVSKAKPRSDKEFRQELEKEFCHDKAPEDVKRFFETLLGFKAGKKTMKQLKNTWKPLATGLSKE